jgi:hypothetical protein
MHDIGGFQGGIRGYRLEMESIEWLVGRVCSIFQLCLRGLRRFVDKLGWLQVARAASHLWSETRRFAFLSLKTARAVS